MKHLVESNSLRTHLLHIETHVQSDPDVDYGYADVERILFCSIEEVREEVRRRYRAILQTPLYVDSGTDNDPQVGLVYDYEADVDSGGRSQIVPYRDYVRVYELRGETVDPEKWKPAPHIKQSHLEEELTDALQKLLDCTELNMDDMEPETRDAIELAQRVLAARQPEQ